MDDETFHLHGLLTSLSFPGAPTLPPSEPSEPPSTSALRHLAAGEYVCVLKASLEALDITRYTTTPPECASEWFEALESAARTILDKGEQAAAAMADNDALRWLTLAAVSALYIFTQDNLTGPRIEGAPESPFDLLSSTSQLSSQTKTQEGAPGESNASASAVAFGQDSMSPPDLWATGQLAENGEDLVGRIHYPQYLLFATKVLRTASPQTEAEGGNDTTTSLPPAWYWWAARATLLQQRVLGGRSAVLRERLLADTQIVLEAFSGEDIAKSDSTGESPAAQQSVNKNISLSAPTRRALAAAALLESSMMETAYGHVAESKEYTDRATFILGLHAELVGALGVRTAHQQDARAQLILQIHCDQNTIDSTSTEEESGSSTAAVQFCGEKGTALDSALLEHSGTNAEVKGLEDESDVLRHPRLVTQKDIIGEATEAAPLLLSLPPLHQAAVLAMCLNMKKGSASDGMQPWEVAAHADAVLQQERGEFLLRAAAHLQASRLERHRSRTRERALLGLEGLTQALDAPGGISPQARMRCAFTVWFPLRIALRKELGEAFVALGIVGAALPLFESLELWDNLIVCYRLMDKKVAAEQLIKTRLEATPTDPRLWCALGDLSLDDAHFLKAWELSGHRSARAQRSLARNAMRNDRFADAGTHWEIALALSPLHAEGWFTLGWCRIKDKDYPKALTALTRAAQMDPNNGEAWNNLAAVHMHLEKWREAYAALSEAVKQKRDSWQTWENYAAVAAKIGEWQVATRAVGQVVALSHGERVDIQVLEQIINVVESGGSSTSGGGGGLSSSSREPTAEERQQEEEDAAAEAAAGEDTGAAAVAEALSSLNTSEKDSHSTNTNSTESKLKPLVSASIAHTTTKAEDEAYAAGTLQILVGNLMKQIAGAAAGGSSFWGLYGRYYTAIGELDAAAECLMKRVRALQSGALSGEVEAFSAYAEACCALARAHLRSGGKRELSQARMLLRAAIRQSAERHSEVEAYIELERTLEEIVAAEEALGAIA